MADASATAAASPGGLVGHPVPTLIALTFAAGMVEAVSFLGPGQVFTANMTGDALLMGFAIAGPRG